VIRLSRAVEERQAQLDELRRVVFGGREQEPSGGFKRRATGGTEDDTLAFAFSRSEKFRRCYHGDLSYHGGDRNRTDLYVCGQLCWWLGGDPLTIDGYFRRSALMRPKWDEKHYADGSTYGQHTIRRAVADPKNHRTPAAGAGPNWTFGKNGAGHAGRRPAPRPAPYAPFPVGALPEPVRAFVAQGAVAMGCDPSYLALPALSVVAALVGNSHTIRLKRTWTEPAVLWTGIVGESGTLKSPAVHFVVAPLYRLQERLLHDFRKDVAEYRREKDLFDGRKRKALKDNKPFDEAPPDAPTPRRVVTGDITIETVAPLLAANPKGLLVCRDELGGWLNSFTRYKGRAGGSDLPNWLEMYRAGPVQVDRKTGEQRTLFIPHAAVSICGGIQPGTLARALTPEYVEAGLGARLLLAMPPRLPKRWTELEVDAEVQDAYEKLLDDLHNLTMEPGVYGTREPFAVRLTPEAKALWTSFYESFAGEQAAAEGELAAAYSKLEGAAARLALVHHVAARVGSLEAAQPVEPAEMAAGITLARWFAAETRRIYGMLGETEEERGLRRLVEFIAARGGKITVKELQRSNSRKYRDADSAKADLDALAQAGLADWIDGESPPHGGKRMRWLVLRPTTDDSDDRPSGDDGDVPQPTDDRADDRSTPCEIPGENERSSESSVVGRDVADDGDATAAGGSSARSSARSSDGEPSEAPGSETPPPPCETEGETGRVHEQPKPQPPEVPEGGTESGGGTWYAPGYEELRAPFDDPPEL
jgi:hypothetical protein